MVFTLILVDQAKWLPAGPAGNGPGRAGRRRHGLLDAGYPKKSALILANLKKVVTAQGDKI